MDYQKLEEIFLQGDGNEAAEIFNEMMRISVRIGLLAALRKKRARFAAPAIVPMRKVYIGELEVRKTVSMSMAVRHEEQGEVELTLYRATRSQRNLFAEVVSAVTEGISARGIARHTKGQLARARLRGCGLRKAWSSSIC